MWLLFAFGSAIFAGLTSILAKCGIRRTDSTVATAVRTIVVLAFSWVMVFVVGSESSIGEISGRSLTFLVLSGLATGASWLCYFKALQLGDINKVVPIDKSSTVLTIVLAAILLREGVSLSKGAGVVLIAIGTFMMIEKKRGDKSQSTAKCAAGNQDTGSTIQYHADSKGMNTELMDSSDTAESEYTTSNKCTGSAKADTIRSDSKSSGYAWLWFALGSAVFASLTAILGKVGITGVESNLGTAIRTIVVLAMSWVMVFVTGKADALRAIPRSELIFICLSGIATGGSWLCYYHALQTGPASVVVPIDKLSILVTVAFSYVVFHEKLTRKSAIGLAAIVAGTLMMLF